MRKRISAGVAITAALGVAAFFGWRCVRYRNARSQRDSDDWERRVRFVCCDDFGSYSPGVYMRVGGGQAAFDSVRQAAPTTLLWYLISLSTPYSAAVSRR